MISPLTSWRRLNQFRADALAFFQGEDLYASPMTTFDMGPTRIHVVTDAQLAQQLLTDERLIRGERAYGPLGTFAGQGVLRELLGPTLPTLDGQDGLTRRRAIRPPYVQLTRALKARELNSPRWRDEALKAGPIDLYEVISAQVFDLLCDVLFGRRYPEHRHSVPQAVDRASALMDLLSKSFRPMGRRYGPLAAELRAQRRTLARFAQEALRALREAPPQEDDAPPLIAALMRQGALDEEQLVDEVITQLVAGIETTSVTCCWCISAMLAQPQQLSALKRADQARAQQHTRYAIMEALRMYPAFWTMIRLADQDLSEATPPIQRGDVLFISPLLIHHNPRHWPDPTRFDPWRHHQRERTHPADYLPFGFGARSCVGAQLATAIAQQVVYQALTEPTLELLDDALEPLAKIIVLKRRGGFIVQHTPAP